MAGPAMRRLGRGGTIQGAGALQQKQESIDMAVVWLIALAAAIEAATGLALIVSPQAVFHLLLGADLAGAGIAVGRVAGAALLSFGLVCWMSRRSLDKSPALVGLLTYNLLVAAYLICLRFGGEFAGILLSPTIVLHAVFSLLLAYACFDDRRAKRQRNEMER